MGKIGYAALVVGLLLLLVGSTPAAAGHSVQATRLVATTGTDAGDCLASPCRTISYAVGQAASGDTISIAAGTYAGGVVLNKDGLVLNGAAGAIVGPGSPAFTVSADNVEIRNLVLDGGDSADPGVLVLAGADNLMLHDCQITGWGDGVELAGSVTSFKVVANWIHGNADAGLQVDSGVVIGGVVTIEGNLFKVNGGNGIQNNSGALLKAEYNSWGDKDGYSAALGGDGISANVDADPFTFIELYMDMEPDTEAAVRYVQDGDTFDVKLKADAAKVYGLSFKLTYDPALLTVNSVTFAAPWAGKCFPAGSPPAGTLQYFCGLWYPTPEWDATGGTIATLNFTAHAGAGSGPWTSFFDISHLPADTSAGAVGGVKVWVNNAGYGAPSLPARDISDTDDGRVIILGETTVTLDPTPAAIQGCEEVEVAVWVNNVLGLYGADIELTFDPAVLEVVDFDPGTPGVQLEIVYGFFNPGWILFNTADNTAGTIHFLGVQLNPTPPANGSGALVNIHFRAKSASVSSPLHFTRTDMSTRDGFMIPNTPVDGTVSTEPPAGSPVLSIARLNSTTARLSWTSVAGAWGYNLYRDTIPYFVAGTPYQTTTALQYDDVGALGDTVIQYYYQVSVVCENGFSGTPTNRVGAYDYVLANAAAVNYADIAIVFENPAYVDAASLASYVGSSVTRIMRYNPATQSFQIYIVGRPATNFPLSLGEFVFVLTNNTAPASVALVGGVPDPGVVWFSLVSGSPVKYNYVTMPLDRPTLDHASDVATDVGGGVYRVMRYREETQTYQIYIPGRPSTDFPLVIGEPFVLQLANGAPARWPEVR